MTDEITIGHVVVDEEAERLVLEVLRSGRLAQGPMVERLEQEFAAMRSVRHAVAVSNGTTALVAAMRAVELEPGDEVVTTPFTFAGTLNAILESGATARFADIEPDTFSLDPNRVAALVTDRTRAVMPVHLYGQPAAMLAVSELASTHGLIVIEDAAQAHGATCAGRAVGSFGVGCFSLYASKNVSAGEGGIVTTDDDAVADRLRLLRNQGMRARYEHEIVGHNYRLTDVQAALAIPQLEGLERSTERRRANAAQLSAGLDAVPGITTPVVGADRTHVFHQYTIRVTPDAALDRDAARRAGLVARGIGIGVYYPRVVFEHDCYRAHPRVIPSEVPEAHRAAREVLSLPVHPHLSHADIDRIIGEIHEAMTG